MAAFFLRACRLRNLLIVLALAAVPAHAQSGSAAGAKQSAPQEGTARSGAGAGNGEAAQPGIDIPLIGHIALPDFISGLFGSGGGDAADQAAARPLPSVVVETVGVQPVGESYDFLGTIQPIQQVQIRPRVEGYIQSVGFHGGEHVAKGDLLFQIEPAQYQASLSAAKAQLSGATAQVHQAQRSLERAQTLARNGTVSQSNLDQAKAAFESAQAQQQQAQAALQQAQLNVGYTKINAPIDGVMSAPMITAGNYVSQSSSELATLVQMDPIWGVFPIDESRLTTWRRVSRKSDQKAVKGFSLSLRLPNGEKYEATGEFDFVGTSVDPQTGTVDARIRFPNPDGVLIPNESVTLVASEKNPPRLPVVPRASVQLSREGQYIFTVSDDDIVSRITIETGKNIGNSIAVTSGLKGGEDVVIEGLQSIQDGMKVNPVSGQLASPGTSANSAADAPPAGSNARAAPAGGSGTGATPSSGGRSGDGS